MPESERQAFDMRKFIRALVDADSFFEVHALWAREVTVGFARLGGQVIGVVANNPLLKGGVLFVDSADKAARFIEICDAFGVPLLFLADVPGFMVGTAVERQGIIRHGARMISAMSQATVPKICVVVRKAYGAGLYAMAGPGFEPDATLALPTAKIAVMGAEAAVNAVYAAKLAQLPEDERAARPPGCGPSTTPTSTSSGSRPSSSSTTSSSRRSSRASSPGGSPPPAANTAPAGPPPPSDQPRLKSALIGFAHSNARHWCNFFTVALLFTYDPSAAGRGRHLHLRAAIPRAAPGGLSGGGHRGRPDDARAGAVGRH